MIVTKRAQKRLKASCLLLLSCISSTYATPSSPWEINVAPYLWAINMNGHVQVGPLQATVSQSFSDIMKHFEGGGMLWLNARKDKFGVFANLLYSVLKQDQTIRTITIGARNNFGIFSAGVSYEVMRYSAANQVSQIALELFAGARNTLNNTKLNVDRLSFSDKQNWTDPIIGTRLTLDLNKQWQLVGSADIGGINKHHSYDLQGYIGYKPSKPLVFKDPVLYLGYRSLYQHYSSGDGLGLYVWNMHINGPVIGFKIIF